jgi:ribosomal protein S6E (S10)
LTSRKRVRYINNIIHIGISFKVNYSAEIQITLLCSMGQDYECCIQTLGIIMSNPSKVALLLLSLSLIAQPTIALAEQSSHDKDAKKSAKNTSKQIEKHHAVSKVALGSTAAGATITSAVAIDGITINAGISVGQAREIAVSHQQTGYSSLPPGIRKKLSRGKPLPPGIAKKLQSPPMLQQLPQHPGYQWQVCGTDLVLVAIASQVIADVLIDVFR